MTLIYLLKLQDPMPMFGCYFNSAKEVPGAIWKLGEPV